MSKGGQMGGGFSNLRDMFDGGGMGRAGQRFEGGPLSGMLNDMGVRPVGYADRMAEQRPQMRPMQPAMMTSRSAPPQGPGPMQGPSMPAVDMHSGPGHAMEYGGRGSVGMPMPGWAEDEAVRQAIEYLRSRGISGY